MFLLLGAVDWGDDHGEWKERVGSKCSGRDWSAVSARQRMMVR